jgi:hypothetical protein
MEALKNGGGFVILGSLFESKVILLKARFQRLLAFMLNNTLQ